MALDRKVRRVLARAAAVLAVLVIGCGREQAPKPQLAVVIPPAVVAVATDTASGAAPWSEGADSVPVPAGVVDTAVGGEAADALQLDSLVTALVDFEAPMTVIKGEESECFAYARYVVVARELRHEVGSDILVRPTDGALRDAATLGGRCAADSLAGDVVLRNEWAEYFLGLSGDWLFLDSGTGPERGLVVHDIAARRKLAELSGVEIVGWRDSATLVLWLAGQESVAPALCPEIPEGFGVSVDTLYALELPAARLSPLGRWRCAARQ
jgi:hypothetical protein